MEKEAEKMAEIEKEKFDWLMIIPCVLLAIFIAAALFFVFVVMR